MPSQHLPTFHLNPPCVRSVVSWSAKERGTICWCRAMKFWVFLRTSIPSSIIPPGAFARVIRWFPSAWGRDVGQHQKSLDKFGPIMNPCVHALQMFSQGWSYICHILMWLPGLTGPYLGNLGSHFQLRISWCVWPSWPPLTTSTHTKTVKLGGSRYRHLEVAPLFLAMFMELLV